MKRIPALIMAFAGLILFTGSHFTHAGDHHSTPYKGSQEFEQIKSLEGAWEGNMGKDGKPYRVEYRITGGGSALVETHFPGTPKEMVSVYHENDGKLEMTHYCMLKNQPRMKLEKATRKSLAFDFAGGDNIDPAKDPHMHALTIKFIDRNTITHRWTMFEKGIAKETAEFQLTRVQ